MKLARAIHFDEVIPVYTVTLLVPVNGVFQVGSNFLIGRKLI